MILPKIFDGFFRTAEAKKMDPYGRGMGLSFVKKVVETLGGTISVSSEKAKGTEFHLAFSKTRQVKEVHTVLNTEET